MLYRDQQSEERRSLIAKPTFDWTDEAVERVKKLWDDGRSAAEIALMIGGGLTRNAVIGKLWRLKKLDRPRVIRPKQHGNKGRPKAKGIVARTGSKRQANDDSRVRTTLMRRLQEPQMEGLPLPEEVEEGIDFTRRIGLIEASDRKGCLYCYGDPLTADHSFCAEPRRPGSSWCEEHHRRVYPTSAPLA